MRQVIHARICIACRAATGLLIAVSKFKSFAKYWLIPLLWAGVIYSASGDRQSVQHSSRLIEPFVRWLMPDISDTAVWRVVLVARKGAHVTEYAVFAVLLWWALRHSRWGGAGGWSKKCARGAWVIATLFAATDEFHQLFVPGREGSIWDVLIDSCGAATGLFLLWLIGRWRKKW